MAKTLTDSEREYYQTVVHDIFEAGGLLKTSRRTTGQNTLLPDYYNHVKHAKNICDEIKNRTFNFVTLDNDFAALHNNRFDKLTERGSFYVKEKQIANFMAAFCAENEIFWDDINTRKSVTELETYRMSTFGKACWNFGCFLSQQKGKRSRSSSVSRSTTADGSAPKSGYKSSGPKSGVIGGLIGKPGEKILCHGNLYVIGAKSDKKKKQYVFIDPLSPISDVNKIRIGDPSGWSCCKLFFEDRAEAESAMERLVTEDTFVRRTPSHVSGLFIARISPDPNGYFKVETEIGPALIKASKLNEAISEDIENDSAASKESTKNSIFDIDVYTEAMLRYN